MDAGFLLVCLSGLFFGTTGVTGRFVRAAYDLSPLALGSWRVFMAAPALILISWATGSLSPVVRAIREDWRNAAGIAVFGASIVGFQLGFFNALQRTRVSTASMIALCTVPVLVAILSGISGLEKLSSGIVVPILLSVAGTALLSSGDVRTILDTSCVVGNLMALGAALATASMTVFGKALVSRMPPTGVTAVSFCCAAAFMLPFSSVPAGLPLRGWLALGYLGVFSAAVAYGLFNYGLSRTSSPTGASIALLMEPLTSTCLAALFLRERLTAWNTAGAILLLVSLGMLSIHPRPARTPGL